VLVLDSFITVLVKISFFLVNLLPVSARVKLIALIVRVFIFFKPSYKLIAHKNLELAFPEKDKVWRDQTIKDSSYSLARLLVDFARMPYIDADWVKEHVEFPDGNKYAKLKRERPGQPVILVGGHIGSFELLPYVYSICGCPMGFIVRNFKLKKLDQWWNSIREKRGNKVINRKGGFKGILRHLKEGKDVGLLIDQNVRKEHAVFVELFSHPAATTRALGMAALKVRAPVLVVSMSYTGLDRYRVDCVECDLSVIYDDSELDRDEKIRQITQLVTNEYEKMIRANPCQWFWFHRRFRTTPPGVEENFYLQRL